MIKVILVVGLVLCTESCSNNSAWEAVAPSSLVQSESLQLLTHCEVIESKSNKYLEGLERKPFMEIENADIDELCDKKIAITKTEKAYVVRALYIGKYTGDYRVVSIENSIWVAHESLAAKSAKAKKSAVVIVTSNPPSNIYVTAYADE